MRIPTTVRVGIGAILVTALLFFGGKFWVETRTFVLVDMPVSLSRGYIETGDFNINVHAFYSIGVSFPEGSTPNCNEGTLRTRRLSSLGKLAVYHVDGDSGGPSGDVTDGPFLGGFESKPGHYNINIEVLSDSGCLNARHPRLYVLASASDFGKWNERYEYICWISFLSGVLGAILLIIAIKEDLRRRSEEKCNLSIFETPNGGQFPKRRKLELVAAFPFFSQIGLLYSQILLLIVIPAVLVFGYAWGSDHHSFGLFVWTYLPGSSIPRHNPCTQEWVVRVESGEAWYLNSERISPDNLSDRLRQQIGERTGCIVFFDAEPNVPFAHAIHAIDQIEQSPGRVVLLTPKTKKIRIP